MSENKNSPQFTLGTILEGNHPRDAIHIAVIAAVAVDRLMPGTPVNFVSKGSKAADWSAEPIGIVDPFLQGPVLKDQQFWIMLFPNTITSLRHEWSHPAIDSSMDFKTAEETLQALAVECGLRYDEILQAGHEWVDHGEYFTQYDHETARDVMGDHAKRQAFWEAFETVSGKKVADKDDQPFSCSC